MQRAEFLMVTNVAEGVADSISFHELKSISLSVVHQGNER